MKYDLKEFEKDILEFREHYENLSAICDDLLKMFGSFDGVIMDRYGKLLDFSLKMLANKYLINEQDLVWFVFENQFGENGFEMSDTNGVLQNIKSIADFFNAVK